MLRSGMSERAKLNPSYLVHWLAASPYRHAGLLLGRAIGRRDLSGARRGLRQKKPRRRNLRRGLSGRGKELNPAAESPTFQGLRWAPGARARDMPSAHRIA